MMIMKTCPAKTTMITCSVGAKMKTKTCQMDLDENENLPKEV